MSEELKKAIETIKAECEKHEKCKTCLFYSYSSDESNCMLDVEPCKWNFEEEQELPCKVGDTIYKIPNFNAYRLHIINNRPQDNKVYEIEITSIKKDDEYRYVLEYSNYYPGYRLEDYGKEWFLTREEAEQALIEVGKRYEDWKAGGKDV